jgi:hypothetical protein
MRNSVSKTVKIQILRIRFLKQSESNFFVYNEKDRGTGFFEREILSDNPILFFSKF